MKNLILFCLIFMMLSCTQKVNHEEIKSTVNQLVDDWHQAATDADFDAYFGLMQEESIFIGTDKKEKWRKEEFMNFAKPYFDKGRAWDFKVIQREVYVAKNGDLAWFDEQLNTWMGICQSSGVLTKSEDGQWLIQHYQLSISIDNNVVNEVIKLHETLKEKN